MVDTVVGRSGPDWRAPTTKRLRRAAEYTATVLTMSSTPVLCGAAQTERNPAATEEEIDSPMHQRAPVGLCSTAVNSSCVP